MAQVRCSVCDRPFDSEQSRTMPFCSERCKLIDLGRWLKEGYGLPYEPAEDEEVEHDQHAPPKEDSR